MGEGPADEQDGVGHAGVAPGVAAGAGDGDAKAAAAEGAGHSGSGARAFERERGGNAMGVRAALEELAHPAKVAFALFADVGGEEDSPRRGDLGEAQASDQAEQGGETGTVVAGSGAEDAWPVFARCGFSAFREDCVEVGGEKEDAVVGRDCAGKLA